MEEVKGALGEGFGEKVLDYMKELAQGLGVAAEHVYAILVRQQFAYGIVYSALSLIGIIILIYATFKIAKFLVNEECQEFLVLLMFPVAGTVGLFFALASGIMRLMNPEYYAIKDILSILS